MRKRAANSMSMAAAILFMTGCATSAYDWGSYENTLYERYSDPSTEVAFGKELEAHVNKLEQRGRSVAPGLYAEVGTSHLRAGRTKAAIRYFEKEAEAWPESRPLMTRLVNRLSSWRSDVGTETTKRQRESHI